MVTIWEDNSTELLKGFSCSATGKWGSTAGSNYHANNTHTTYDIDCSLTISFSGAAVGVFGDFNYDHSLFACSLNGTKVGWFNGFVQNIQTNSSICQYQGLPAGTHELKVWSGVQSAPISIDYVGIWATGPVQSETTGVDGVWTGDHPIVLPTLLPGYGLTSNSSNTTISQPSISNNSSPSISTGAAVGIAIAAILVVEALLALLYFFLRRNRDNAPKTVGTYDPEGDKIVPFIPPSKSTDTAQSHLRGESEPFTPTSGGRSMPGEIGDDEYLNTSGGDYGSYIRGSAGGGGLGGLAPPNSFTSRR